MKRIPFYVCQYTNFRTYIVALLPIVMVISMNRTQTGKQCEKVRVLAELAFNRYMSKLI